MENLSGSPKEDGDNTLLCEVYLCIVETENRVLTLVSKNRELSQEEKRIIEGQYGKIYCIYDNVGSNVGVLLNLT